MSNKCSYTPIISTEPEDVIRKRVTLHPLKSDGTVDTEVNLYPKVFLDGIVDRDGNPVDVALLSQLTSAVDHLTSAISDLASEIAGYNYTTYDTMTNYVDSALVPYITSEVFESTISSYATVSAMSSAISSLSSIYAPISNYATASDLVSLASSIYASLDQYGATNVLSDSFISIFYNPSESGNIVANLNFDSTIYSLLYSLASLSSELLVKQRVEVLTNNRPILLDRFTANANGIYCDFNYTGSYGKIEGIANFYSMSGSNYCELDTTYGVYVTNFNWE